MDLVSIILCILKKWKAALICSIIGGILMLLLILVVETPFWEVSAIIYLITFIVSLINLSKSSQLGTTHSRNSSSTDIEYQLNTLQSFYDKGLISLEEYETRRADILNRI